MSTRPITAAVDSNEDVQKTFQPRSQTAEASLATLPTTATRRRRRKGTAPGSSRGGTSTSDRPDTSTSSIGDVPDQTFFPEGDTFDEDEEYTDGEEEDAEVFAFHRPGTGAVLGGFEQPPPTSFGNSTISEGDEMSTRMGSSSVRKSSLSSWKTPGQGPPLTAGSSRPRTGFSFGFSGRKKRGQTGMTLDTNRSVQEDEEPSAIETDMIPSSSYLGSNSPTGNEERKRSPREVNFDGISTVPSLEYEDRFRSDTSDGLDDTSRGRPTTGHTRGSHRPSFMSSTSLGTSIPEDDQSYTSSIDGSKGGGGGGGNGYRMRSFAPLVGKDELETIPGSRAGSRATWGISEVDGTATVPDGMTTRGDGLGRMYEKWDPEVGTNVDPDMLGDEDSPYPEVRASVSNIDDPDMPALTIRAWFLGMFFAVVACAVNVFFQFRNPAPSIPPLVIQVIAYPCGKFLAAVLPLHTIHFPKWLGGGSIDLNPGPFNIKEHTCIVVMSSVSFGPVTGLHVSAAAQKFYHLPINPMFTLLIVISTQMAGFGLAGMARRFLVWPGSMVWPYNLVIATNLNAFHAEDDVQSGGMTRFKFFMICASAAFAYYFLPGFLFTALSYFSWVCWIKPNNLVVNQLFGVNTGLGMGILTFDWSQVIWIGSPLTAPWWAEANVGAGFILFYWIVVPIIYYTNTWYTSFLPMTTSAAFDRFGAPYNASRVLTANGDGLDEAAYHAYSPVYIAATFAMTLLLAFALSTAMIVHTALHHGPQMWNAIRQVYSEPDDIHMKLMRQYEEVPDWWYGIILVTCIVFGIIAIEVYKVGLPVYALFISLLLPAIYFIPSGFIYAMTAQQVAINLLAELIPGFLLPNHPVPNMLAKSYATETLYEALQFTQGLKLGHYMKVPPRSLFAAQTSAMAVSCIVSFAVKEWLFSVVPDICTTHQKNLLSCPYTTVYYNSSILWGVIGPRRLFGSGGLYHPEVYALIGGAILPIPFWYLGKRFPKSFIRLVNTAVLLNGSLNIPPATGINYASWLAVGFTFQYVIRRRHFAWWSKYNYTLSAALDVGTILSGIFIFLTLGLPEVSVNWIGNTIFQNTADWNGLSLRTPPETGFGPDTWI